MFSSFRTKTRPRQSWCFDIISLAVFKYNLFHFMSQVSENSVADKSDRFEDMFKILRLSIQHNQEFSYAFAKIRICEKVNYFRQNFFLIQWRIRVGGVHIGIRNSYLFSKQRKNGISYNFQVHEQKNSSRTGKMFKSLFPPGKKLGKMSFALVFRPTSLYKCIKQQNF